MTLIFRHPVLKDPVQDCYSNYSVKFYLELLVPASLKFISIEINGDSIRNDWNLLGFRMCGGMQDVLLIYISTIIFFFQT